MKIGNVCAGGRVTGHTAVMANDKEFLLPVDPRMTTGGMALKLCADCGSVYGEAVEPVERTTTVW